MATRCKVCLSENCNEVNRLLVRGVPPAGVAEVFKFPVGAVQNHRKHVPKMLQLAHQEKLALGADSIARELTRLYGDATELFSRARQELDQRESGTPAMDRAFMMCVTSLREVARLLEVAAGMVEKLPKEKEEIVIRVVDEDSSKRDEFNDILPGLQNHPPLAALARGPASPTADDGKPNEEPTTEEVRCMLSTVIPEDLLQVINRLRFRQNLAPLPARATFRDAVELAPGGKRWKEPKV